MSGAPDVYRLAELKNSCELAVEHAVTPTDNRMGTKEEIARFIEGLVHGVIVGSSPFMLVDMAYVAGPPFWRLCCYYNKEFFRLFHKGEYLGWAHDKRMAPTAYLKKSETLRKVSENFQRFWARFEFRSPHSTRIQWLNMRGDFFSPSPSVPSYEHRCKDSEDEYCIEYYDGRGRLSRKVRDSNGTVLNPMVGLPCHVLSRDHVVDTYTEWDDTIDAAVDVNVHSAWLEVQYEIHSERRPHEWSGYITIQLYPDSDDERDNFKDAGYKASHPLVLRNYPKIMESLVVN